MHPEHEKDILVLKERIAALERLNRELVEQNETLRKENDNHKELLAFLPSNAKEQIKRNAKKNSPALRYKMVTVLYAEVKGFNDLLKEQDAEALIDELDRFFLEFERIAQRHNILKIRSIGDSVICAGGIPQKNRTNPIEVIMAALEVQSYLKTLQNRSKKNKKNIWSLTFGIHTGRVTASFSGKRKKNYTLKGDTVDIASRIESTAMLNEICISQTTYEFIKPFFACEFVSKIPVKYKGGMPLYTVKGYQPALSIDRTGKFPNKNFRTKFQMLRFEDLNDYVLDRLERELPKHLYYHNYKHTIDVTIGVEIIGYGERVNEEEMLLLKTAALFHDFGQIEGAQGHEERSCRIAESILPNYGYSKKQIETINGIIMATQLPPHPKTLLQQIIADADLDYLGRKDMIPISDNLYQELKVQGLIGSFNDWNKLQIKFLSNHQFFTKTAKNMRKVNKEKQIERIKKLIEND
ncbi:MAG: guanylate cyclase [Bacteroidia bacterium]|nr:MAG: guanylate cyclase [Bacteroidia bacterium]